MTKCIVIGDQPREKKKNPIQFVTYLNCNLEFSKTDMHPRDFENLELICKNYSDEIDLIFGYENNRDDRDESVLFLGHWNDGVPE